MTNKEPQLNVSKEFDKWHDLGRADSMQNEHIIAVEAALKEMQLTPGINTLDVGCGNGYTVRIMAKHIAPDGNAYGIDISEKMLNSAKTLSKEFNNVHFKAGNFSNLSFDDDFFDIITSVESIYYAENMLNALNEVKRVLKPGGKFYCITYFYKEHKNSAVWADYIPLKMHYLSESEYKELFIEAGFSHVEIKRIFDPRPVDKYAFEPKWGYNTVEELIFFKEHIGAMLIIGSYGN